MSQLELGAFRLARPIAEGGMAVVWGGHHSGSDLPVAVKVLTGGDARDPLVRTLFRNEVRAVAKLAHPGIIAVLDFGEVPPEVAAASDGRLIDGAPYLVMEYAGGGALGKRKRSWSWSALRRTLHALLEALGHAHARGVVHRDLKPSNILLAGRGDLRGGVKLTDFGIAWVGGAAGHTMAGTLHYMAPEQHTGDWAAFGPWTDLYSLACVAWRIITGRTPFAHLGGRAVARAHLFEQPPVLEPRFPVPEDLEGWLRVLLQKDPATRFPCAADALAALAELAVVEEETDAEDLGDVEVGDGDISESTSSPAAEPMGAGRAIEAEHPPALVASLPADCTDLEPEFPVRLRGAGLGLFSLREVPLFGREDERDLLWRGLKGAADKGRPRLVLIRGPAGVGKTRLAEWLVRRAHERGGVSSLTVRGNDLAPAVAELLGVERLEGPERSEHVQERLRHVPAVDTLAPALVAGLAPEGPEDRVAWHQAVVHLLEWHSRDRPALLVVDDAHEAEEVLDLVQMVATQLEDDERRAVLVVLMVRDEELADDPEMEERLRRATGGARAREIRLGPLSVEARRGLLSYVGLSGPLAARVDERSKGNPQFAIQLLAQWVQQGVLEAGADGLALVPGAEPQVPDDLEQVWASRVNRILQPLPAVGAIHLERAAALGMEVDDHEWDRVCDDPVRGRVSEVGLQIRGALLERLLDASLVEERPRGWAFLQPMLRESLIQQARRGRRYEGHHKAIVQMLTTAAEPEAIRVGLHMLEAGDAQGAVEHMLAGLQRGEQRRGVVALSVVLMPLERAMRASEVPPDDVRWARLWRRHATLLRQRGRAADALKLEQKARALADAAEDIVEWARCTRSMARTLQELGDLPEALRILQKAVARMLRAGVKGLDLGSVLLQMAVLGRMMNDLAGADRWASQGLAMVERSGEDAPGLQGNLIGELAVISNRRKDFERALELFEEAKPLLEASGQQTALADLENNRGDAYKNLGQWTEAEACFESAVERSNLIGIDPTIPRLNLALCRVHQGEWDIASDMIDVLLKGRPSKVDTAIAVCCRALCDAARGNYAAVDRALGSAVETLRKAQFVDPDVAWLAVEGAEQAQIGGAVDTARALWFLAREQYAGLNDEESVQAVNLALAALDDGGLS